MKYVVVEIQTLEDGRVAAPANAFEEESQALAKYYTVLAAAARSSVPVHSCILMTNEGFPLRHECFKHNQDPEPEPTEEPEAEAPGS